MTNRAIDWIRTQKTTEPEQTVLRLFRSRRDARSASRSQRAGSTASKGSSTKGWDKVRDETLARQKQLGVVPPNTINYAASQVDSGVGSV